MKIQKVITNISKKPTLFRVWAFYMTVNNKQYKYSKHSIKAKRPAKFLLQGESCMKTNLKKLPYCKNLLQ